MTRTLVITTALALGVAGFAACKKAGSTKNEGTSSNMAPDMTPPRPPDHPAEAYRCEKDGDCIRTCGQGVVNRAWYKKHEFKLERCKDGCAGPRRMTLTCEAGACVGRSKDGMVNTYCTRKKITWRR